jgi:hypothetical protein
MRRIAEDFDRILLALWRMEEHISAKPEQIASALRNEGLQGTAVLVRFYCRLAVDDGLMSVDEAENFRLTSKGHDYVEAL